MGLKKSAQTTRIKRDTADLERILRELPENPMPWGAVLRMVLPFVARLGVRYALQKVSRSLSEEKVNTLTDTILGVITEALGK